MGNYLKKVPLDEAGTMPVNCVCYHPLQERRIDDDIEPMYCAVETEDDPAILADLCEALGWQGGTIHDAIAEVRRLKAAAK